MGNNEVIKVVFLWPFSLLYGWAMALRAIAYRRGFFKSYRAEVPVISIGNIVAGGTGKTPMAIYVASLLMREGRRVAILSRGYKRKPKAEDGSRVLVVSDGLELKCGWEQAGDEPYLMAKRLLGTVERPGAMVIVGRDRVAGAKEAVELGAQAIVLDDGFQHLRLKRDLDIVLLDSRRPYDNGWVLPAGMLREPVAAMCRADIVVLTRRDEVLPPAVAEPINMPGHRDVGKIPEFYANHRATKIMESVNGRPVHREVSTLRGKNALLVSGIARPASFRNTAELLGCNVVGELIYPDHHRYNQDDLRAINRTAQSADVVLTTEKDLVRLPGQWSPARPLYSLQVEIDLVKDEETFKQKIFSKALVSS